ncbi:hypothetical protein BGZ83_003509 [Gryganskiella cystojenkinii]|nr:hypothetical protein BGZ83_003509 [Gryganskiella cystojenkinii]
MEQADKKRTHHLRRGNIVHLWLRPATRQEIHTGTSDPIERPFLHWQDSPFMDRNSSPEDDGLDDYDGYSDFESDMLYSPHSSGGTREASVEPPPDTQPQPPVRGYIQHSNGLPDIDIKKVYRNNDNDEGDDADLEEDDEDKDEDEESEEIDEQDIFITQRIRGTSPILKSKKRPIKGEHEPHRGQDQERESDDKESDDDLAGSEENESADTDTDANANGDEESDGDMEELEDEEEEEEDVNDEDEEDDNDDVESDKDDSDGSVLDESSKSKAWEPMIQQTNRQRLSLRKLKEMEYRPRPKKKTAIYRPKKATRKVSELNRKPRRKKRPASKKSTTENESGNEEGEKQDEEKQKKKPTRGKRAREEERTWIAKDLFPEQFASASSFYDQQLLETAIRNHRLQKDKIQSELFREPVNSRSKLRFKKPLSTEFIERSLSSDPNNPFLDTTDSELDEVESDVELQLDYEVYREDRDKPYYHEEQDGDVCMYCGAFIPFETSRHAKPYPTIYQCVRCLTSQEGENGPTSEETLQAHRTTLEQMEQEVARNRNGWPTELFMPDRPIGDHDSILRNLQPLPPTQSKIWESCLESLSFDQYLKRFPFGSRAENRARYWSTGSPLIAGGMDWTSEEGDLFFQGLRRFGKHNVWAVQEHIKTRSLAEVVAMIQAMEVEIARLKASGDQSHRLSQMPMAVEVSEDQVAVEERCAAILIDQELQQAWNQNEKASPETQPEIVQKSSLFNLKELCSMSSRLYVRHHGASMERDVVTEMYDSLKKWLTPIVQELVEVQNERHRVGLVLNKKTPLPDMLSITEADVIRTLNARQLPLDAEKFIASLPARLGLQVVDDSKSSTGAILTPRGVDSGLGRSYYLNHEVDEAQALAPDSDQDVDTDDGVSAEEESEIFLEAPLAVIPTVVDATEETVSDVTERYYRDQSADNLHWELFWSTKARQARQIGTEMAKLQQRPSSVPRKRSRFRETHPLKPTPLPFEAWKEGVERLAANSFALPMDLANSHILEPTVYDPKNIPIHSMNKRQRTHDQLLYADRTTATAQMAVTEKETHQKLVRVRGIHTKFQSLAEKMQRPQPIESYAPGYGVLPTNASFMYDETRHPPKNSYGLGERDPGGLWLMDARGFETASGYITVSDTEDEEEEEEGWKRQMKADQTIEERQQNNTVH